MNLATIDPAHAKLPATYVAARKAMAECSRLDECQQWADKAQALASYARQSKDDQLRKLADRIQARAVRRCGELLKQIEPARGANQNIQDGAVPKVTRESAATDAGLSERQRKTALRVANVPEAAFTEQVESENPPTVTQLAQQGTQRRDGFASVESNPLLEQVRKFARFCGGTDAASLAASVSESEKPEFQALIGEVDAWLDQFITSL